MAQLKSYSIVVEAQVLRIHYVSDNCATIKYIFKIKMISQMQCINLILIFGKNHSDHG